MVTTREMHLLVSTSGVLLCALALTACGGSHHNRVATHQRGPAKTGTTASPATTPPPNGGTAVKPPTCAPLQLRLRLVSSQGATGHLEATFAFTNSSRSRCRLFGYPGARMLSATGRALRTIIQRGDGFFSYSRRATRAVLVAPGASARFSLGWSDNNEQGGSPASCPRADRLEVTPPNDYGTLAISVRSLYFAPCNGRLTVSPVHG